MDEMRDPSLTLLGVFTESRTAGAGAQAVRRRHRSDALLDSWHALVGRGQRRPSYLKVNPLAGKRRRATIRPAR